MLLSHWWVSFLSQFNFNPPPSSCRVCVLLNSLGYPFVCRSLVNWSPVLLINNHWLLCYCYSVIISSIVNIRCQWPGVWACGYVNLWCIEASSLLRFFVLFCCKNWSMLYSPTGLPQKRVPGQHRRQRCVLLLSKACICDGEAECRGQVLPSQLLQVRVLRHHATTVLLCFWCRGW